MVIAIARRMRETRGIRQAWTCAPIRVWATCTTNSSDTIRRSPPTARPDRPASTGQGAARRHPI